MCDAHIKSFPKQMTVENMKVSKRAFASGLLSDLPLATCR